METEVIKEFTKYDYIVAHQKMYGWASFKDSCPRFQKDLGYWTEEECVFEVGDEFPEYEFSESFYRDGIKFGFLKNIDDIPEEFYFIEERSVRVKGGKHHGDVIIDTSLLKEDKKFSVNLKHFNYEVSNSGRKIEFTLKKN